MFDTLRRAEAHRSGSRGRRRRPEALEFLEARALLSVVLTPQDVQALLSRAAQVTPGDGAIVAVVDREGRPLGVRVEGNVSPSITGSTEKLVFSVDGALAEARTGAMFASDRAALTSRTAQFLAQSTMTEREIRSDPDVADPSTRGPGFVAPIGANAHFPPGIKFQPEVGPFEIEHTNRDSIVSPGADHVRGTSDDILLAGRFNANPINIPAGGSTPAPESYGFLTGLLPNAQSRGLGTLPGGNPIYKGGNLVGGIGVFFPGTTGYATEENSSLNDAANFDPSRPDLAEEAEYVAFVAAGGSKAAGVSFNSPAKKSLPGLTPLDPSFDLPFGRIDVNGITLDIYGSPGTQGPANLVAFGRKLPRGDASSGANLAVDAQGDTSLGGQAEPDGWLVLPHPSADGSLTSVDVDAMIARGIAAASKTRSGLRHPLNSPTAMVFAVADRTGEVLGLYRMHDAPTASLDEAVAKARNVAYFDDPARLQASDRPSNLPAGLSFSTRTVRYLSGPRFPEGIDGQPPGPFSILNETTVDGTGHAQAANSFQTVQGFDSFNPQSNFHDSNNIANQNGVVSWPGGVSIYKTIDGQRTIVGGLGVGGDLPDQDDVVVSKASTGFGPPDKLRADQAFVRGVRLPYLKFNRHPNL